jgi:hypothetical protein
MKTLLLLLLGVGGLGACASPGAKDRSVESSAPQPLSVIPLEHAVAAQVADALSRVRPDVRVVADQRTNSVIVACASEAELAQIRDCIAKLDTRVESRQ